MSLDSSFKEVTVFKVFGSCEFSYKRCSEMFPEICEPLFCGPEKKRAKFPTKCPAKCPCEKSKSSPTSFWRSAGRTFGMLRNFEGATDQAVGAEAW